MNELLPSPVSFTSEGGGYHVLEVQTTLPGTPGQVFPLFADAGNLERITPPSLSFEIVSPRPIVMGVGTLIDYRLRLSGLPLAWGTEITEWDPPRAFTDSQLRGPYHTWVHRHTFELAEAGESPEAQAGLESTRPGPATLMTDRVRFRLPLWPLGQVALPLVKRRLCRIFEYRGKEIRGLLPGGSSSG